MTDIVQHSGWYWPKADCVARSIITADVGPDIAALLPHIEGRDCIVQAGANVGVYPVALADHFKSVITAEPDPANMRCLIRNLATRDSLNRVSAYELAFGEHAGTCEPVHVAPSNCGAHRVEFGEGGVQVATIDLTLVLRKVTACDAIWLDVEGAELFALKGAQHTIEAFNPVIAIEDKGLDGKFFGLPRGAALAWLESIGYRQVAEYGRDKVFKRDR